MDGGGLGLTPAASAGLRRLVDGMSNADAIAFAIVGAARAYGDDPIEALTTSLRSKLSPARSVTPAINALAKDKADIRALSRILGRNPAAVETARRKTTPVYLAAVAGARSLVDFAADQAEEEDDDEGPGFADVGEVGPGLSLGTEGVEAVLPPAADPRTVAAFARSAAERVEAARSYVPPKGAGPVSAQTVPFGIPAGAGPSHAASVRARLLEALFGKALGAQSLATLVDAKELVVGQTLAQLEKEGLVTGDRSQGEGARAVRWSLAAAWEGA